MDPATLGLVTVVIQVIAAPLVVVAIKKWSNKIENDTIRDFAEQFVRDAEERASKEGLSSGQKFTLVYDALINKFPQLDKDPKSTEAIINAALGVCGLGAAPKKAAKGYLPPADSNY